LAIWPAQGVMLGNPRNMSQTAEKGREAQRAAAGQFAANVLPVIEGVKAAGATSFDASPRRSMLAAYAPRAAADGTRQPFET
jgi:hypothetical protein